MNARVLYEGNLQTNTAAAATVVRTAQYQTATYNLLEQVDTYVSCVRLERVK